MASRLREALKKRPDDPYAGVARAVMVNYSGEIANAHSASLSDLRARVESFLTSAVAGFADRLHAMVRSEVAAQMPVIPPPQITRITEQPITQVIERPTVVEKTIERVVTERESDDDDDDTPIRVVRDKKGRLLKLVRGKRVITVVRDEDGLIKGLK